MQVIRTNVVPSECQKEVAYRALIVKEPKQERNEACGRTEKSFSTPKAGEAKASKGRLTSPGTG